MSRVLRVVRGRGRPMQDKDATPKAAAALQLLERHVRAWGGTKKKTLEANVAPSAKDHDDDSSNITPQGEGEPHKEERPNDFTRY